MENFLKKNIWRILVAIVAIALSVFLFDKDGVGKTGWQIIADNPTPIVWIAAGAVVTFFGAKALIKKYNEDGVDEGGIHYGMLVLALALSLTFISTCNAKADSTVPRNEVDSTREAAGETIERAKALDTVNFE
jgi:hypothetical protein